MRGGSSSSEGIVPEWRGGMDEEGEGFVTATEERMRRGELRFYIAREMDIH